MRMKCGVLLIFVAFLANFGVTLALDQPSEGTPRLRSLTVYNVASHNDNEERAPVLSKLAELEVKMRPSASNVANKLWLKSLTDPKEVFKTLRLGEASVTKLDENPKFLQWLDYVNLYTAKKGKHWFRDIDVFNLLRQTTPDAELVALLQSIKLVPGMKESAEKMQQFLVEVSSPATRRWMNEVWLGSGETPRGVFNILRLGNKQLEDNPMFLQWLRFTERYKAKVGESVYSDRQTLNFLMDAKPLAPDVDLAELFLSLKRIPDLKRLGGGLEMNLFRKWMTTLKFEPKDVASLLSIRKSVPKLPKSDPRYKILEAYTLQFAAEKSGKEALGKVNELLAANNLNAALTAAAKAR